MKITKKGIIKKPISKKDMLMYIEEKMHLLALDWENNVKLIIADNAVDTGEFMSSIWSEVKVNDKEVKFIGHDGVSYGIFFEKGTKAHWVPFYRYGNINEPVLADWGKRVLGMTEEEMLKMGGMKVKTPELNLFIKSLLLAQDVAPEIFRKSKINKQVKKV